MSMEALSMGVLLPGTVALTVYLAGNLVRSFNTETREVPWTGAVAIGLGYIVGQLSLMGLPSLLPVEAYQWLTFLALAGLVLGFSDIWLWTHKWMRRSFRMVLSLTVPLLLLMPLWKHAWEPGSSVLWVTLTALGLYLFWATLESVAQKIQNLSLSLVTLVLAIGTSMVLALSGSLLLGQLGGVLAAALGASFLFAIFNPAADLQKSSVAVVSVVLPALWIIGWFYSEMPTASLVALAFTPVLLLLTQKPVQALHKPLRIAVTNGVVSMIPVAVAIVVAIQSTPADYPL